MIPNEAVQTIETVGGAVEHIANFDITDETMPRILVDLSDKMYNQKELAVVREYSTNAADAMVKAGKPISEIQVTVPTLESFVFKIRDFGSGLSENDVKNIYCILGKSDKRNSNAYNGMFGYGCKAGFAHADTFTVTSWYEGTKTVYQCIKGDTTKLHAVFRLSRTQSDEPSGIEVAIPVRQNSMWTFHGVVSKFYRYWDVLPTIHNLSMDETKKMEDFRKNVATLKGEGWEVRPAGSSAKGVAFMGYVAYPIDWDILYTKMSLTQQTRSLFELLKANNVTLFYKIGEITFVNNREGLEYTEATLKALMDRVGNIFTKVKDSIQEKFTPQINLWEAKKMYNAIFGTGVLELERGEFSNDVLERVRILDGNLMKLEQTFAAAFTWNGIILDGPSFQKINRFDNLLIDVADDDHNPASPVMVTYRKKKKRVKVYRCSDDYHKSILASTNAAVLVNDTGTRTGVQQAARYLIFKEGSQIRVVHVLKFDTDGLKEKFYAEYHFDSVPVILLSSILPAAKTWNNANKISRNYGGGGGGIRIMKYIDITSGEVAESEVPIRQIEDGGYFMEVAEHKRKRVRLADKRIEREPEDFANELKLVVEKLGIEVERVYIISKQTESAKWFHQAKESGEWTNVWDYIKENLSVLDPDALIDADKYEDHCFICAKNAAKIGPRIFNKKSPFLKLIKAATATEFEENIELAKAIKCLQLWDDFVKNAKGTVDFVKESEQAIKRYPFLDSRDLQYDSMDNNKLAHVVKYVNAMDLWIDMSPEKETA
jgi:hypothetical protein